jgi:formylglycine-generating enzyme required for sulfatase activity
MKRLKGYFIIAYFPFILFLIVSLEPVERANRFFVASAHAELPDWVKPLQTGTELLRPPEGFVFIKGGCFEMGDTFGDGEGNEKPVHEVCVDDFYMGETEITQRQWTEIMGPAPESINQGSNPSSIKNCDDCPVEQVNWNDVQDFINKLNQRHPGRVEGMKYRLPTEAEWEYAARSGGKKEKFAGISSESELREYAWYDENSGNKTHPVKEKRQNGLGLYDMSGNIWEWCSDWYDDDYYRKSPKDNPQGPSSGLAHVLRGGSWSSEPQYLRASCRNRGESSRRFDFIGFRCVLSH